VKTLLDVYVGDLCPIKSLIKLLELIFFGIKLFVYKVISMQQRNEKQRFAWKMPAILTSKPRAIDPANFAVCLSTWAPWGTSAFTVKTGQKITLQQKFLYYLFAILSHISWFKGRGYAQCISIIMTIQGRTLAIKGRLEKSHRGPRCEGPSWQKERPKKLLNGKF
jgi:hypothetical protein